ncbi:MAG: hypothetical protein O9346_03875 [Leptospiraceae bacterium]|nr:hypothetical protein [Leptospiraceae bacterium]MCZ8345534.1 hypothetical protein [Leptospiraceae bacterium]
MSKLKVYCIGIFTDGYGAGINQSLENPLGLGGMGLHECFFPTQVFQAMHLTIIKC